MKVLIVGNGIAGNQVAFSLRERNRDIEIGILSAESVPEYDPCSLPYFLGGDCTKKTVFRRKRTDYKRQRIELVYDSKVVSISPQAKTVTTEKGVRFAYDKLVLAHGGDLFGHGVDVAPAHLSLVGREALGRPSGAGDHDVRPVAGQGQTCGTDAGTPDD